jgi:quaternary ammonium compound-resistance protein SugE
MAWLALCVAGLFEVGWAVGLKQSQGFTRPLPAVFTIAAMIASFACLGLALRTLPLGTVYAVWTGIGTIGVVVMGIALFGESMAWDRLLCIALIVIGIAGLRLTARL